MTSDGAQYIHARPVTRARKCQRNVGQGIPPGLNSLNIVYSNSEKRQGLLQRRKQRERQRNRQQRTKRWRMWERTKMTDQSNLGLHADHAAVSEIHYRH